MPTCFEFHRVSDGVQMTLDEIDKEMCEDTGVAYNTKTYCNYYQILTLYGLAMARDKGHVTKESFDSIAADRMQDWNTQELALARKYLYEKYVFSAWWQST